MFMKLVEVEVAECRLGNIRGFDLGAAIKSLVAGDANDGSVSSAQQLVVKLVDRP